MKTDRLKSRILNDAKPGELVIAQYGTETIKGIVVGREDDFILVVKLANEPEYNLTVVRVRDGDTYLSFGSDWRFDVEFGDLSGINFEGQKKAGDILITKDASFLNVIHGSQHSKNTVNFNLQSWKFDHSPSYGAIALTKWSILLTSDEDKEKTEAPFFIKE